MFAYWIKANKESLNQKDIISWIYSTVSQVSCPSLRGLFSNNLAETKRKKIVRKKNGVQPKYEKKRIRLWRLKAMPFQIEARKCNHGATGGLLELGSKFNGTYIHMKSLFEIPY